jgi:hypothetical protein
MHFLTAKKYVYTHICILHMCIYTYITRKIILMFSYYLHSNQWSSTFLNQGPYFNHQTACGQHIYIILTFSFHFIVVVNKLHNLLRWFVSYKFNWKLLCGLQKKNIRRVAGWRPLTWTIHWTAAIDILYQCCSVITPKCGRREVATCPPTTLQHSILLEIKPSTRRALFHSRFRIIRYFITTCIVYHKAEVNFKMTKTFCWHIYWLLSS